MAVEDLCQFLWRVFDRESAQKYPSIAPGLRRLASKNDKDRYPSVHLLLSLEGVLSLFCDNSLDECR
jgi:hypothetical protein